MPHGSSTMHPITDSTCDESASELFEEMQAHGYNSADVSEISDLLCGVRSSTRTAGPDHEDALATWWADTPRTRDAMWESASRGGAAALMFSAWLVTEARISGLERFAALTACDLLDLARLAQQQPGPTRRVGEAVESWCADHGIRPGSVAPDTIDGSWRVTRATMQGTLVSLGELDSAILFAGLTGRAIVAEFSDHSRRHVLEPVHLADPAELNSDALCVDRATGDFGWLSHSGLWLLDESD